MIKDLFKDMVRYVPSKTIVGIISIIAPAILLLVAYFLQETEASSIYGNGYL